MSEICPECGCAFDEEEYNLLERHCRSAVATAFCYAVAATGWFLSALIVLQLSCGTVGLVLFFPVAILLVAASLHFYSRRYAGVGRAATLRRVTLSSAIQMLVGLSLLIYFVVTVW